MIKNSKKVLIVLLISFMVFSIFTISNAANNTSWNLYFENIEISDGSVTAISEPTITDSSKSEITYSVNLNTPGEFYEFTVDVKNAGTLDAMVSEINGNQLTEKQKKFLLYEVKYLDGTEIKKYDKLKAGSTETLRIRLEFKKDITAEDLPTEATTLTLSINTCYVQADTNAKARNTVSVGGNTIGSKMSEITLGDYVDIGTSILPANTTIGNSEVVKEDWRVFNKDENGMTIILSKFLPNSEGTASSLGMVTQGANFVDVDWSLDCMDQLYNKLNADWSRVITGSDVIGQQGVTVKGAPNINEWANSWNNKGYTHIYTRAAAHQYHDITNLDSYYVGTDGANTNSVSIDFGENYIGLTDSLYFPEFYTGGDYFYYWIANPSQDGEWTFHTADSSLGIMPVNVCSETTATRPIVYLPSNLTITQTENGWKVE